jgi:hypothetical protein
VYLCHNLNGQRIRFSRMGRKMIKEDCSITGVIVGAYVDDKERGFHMCAGDTVVQKTKTIVLVELLDFDKGRVLEVPLENIVMDMASGI